MSKLGYWVVFFAILVPTLAYQSPFGVGILIGLGLGWATGYLERGYDERDYREQPVRIANQSTGRFKKTKASGGGFRSVRKER